MIMIIETGTVLLSLSFLNSSKDITYETTVALFVIRMDKNTCVIIIIHCLCTARGRSTIYSLQIIMIKFVCMIML